MNPNTNFIFNGGFEFVFPDGVTPAQWTILSGDASSYDDATVGYNGTTHSFHLHSVPANNYTNPVAMLWQMMTFTDVQGQPMVLTGALRRSAAGPGLLPSGVIVFDILYDVNGPNGTTAASQRLGASFGVPADDAWHPFSLPFTFPSDPGTTVSYVGLQVLKTSYGEYWVDELALQSTALHPMSGTSVRSSQPAPALSASPAGTASGGAMRVSWSGAQTTTDWIGLYLQGATDTDYLDWVYLEGSQTAPSAPVSSGSLAMSIPPTPGSYEFRLFSADTYRMLAKSEPVAVAGPLMVGGTQGAPPRLSALWFSLPALNLAPEAILRRESSL